MLSSSFLQATLERMVRSAAAAILASTVVADGIFDVANLTSWKDAGTIGAGAAVFTLLFCVVGQAATGSGPALTNAETTNVP